MTNCPLPPGPAEFAIYQLLTPIDFWPGWSRPILRADHEPERPDDVFVILRPAYATAWELAQEGARHLGWPGDVREGEGVFVSGAFLPEPLSWGSTGFMLGWKEDNNGTTYIASPITISGLHFAAQRMAMLVAGSWWIVDMDAPNKGFAEAGRSAVNLTLDAGHA